MPVNSYIPRLSFDGSPYKVRLPTALDMAEMIARLGRSLYIYKLDLSRAYRQLPFDPLGPYSVWSGKAVITWIPESHLVSGMVLNIAKE